MWLGWSVGDRDTQKHVGFRYQESRDLGVNPQCRVSGQAMAPKLLSSRKPFRNRELLALVGVAVMVSLARPLPCPHRRTAGSAAGEEGASV